MGKAPVKTVRRTTRSAAKPAAAAEHMISKRVNNPYDAACLPPLQPDGNRLISKKEMLAYLGGVSWPAVWSWIRPGKFPSPRQLGGRVFWIEGELYAHIISRPVTVYKQPAEVA